MGNMLQWRRPRASGVERSLESLGKQRIDLEGKKKLHMTSANKDLQQARAFKAQGDNPSAIACMRKHKMHTVHIATISGMINTLTDHIHSLESKIMSSDTMSVMKESVQVMSNNAMNIDDVDDLMVRSEEQQQDVAHITNAMSSMGPTDSDEDLLDMLSAMTNPNETPHAQVEPSDIGAIPTFLQDTEPPDDAFERSLEAEIQMMLTMPGVPTHPLPVKQDTSGPLRMTMKPPAYANIPKPIAVAQTNPTVVDNRIALIM